MATALMLAGSASLAQAAGYVVDPGRTARSNASASIIALEAPPQLVSGVAGSTTAIDGEGRALSVSLQGAAPAADIAARATLAPDRRLSRMAAGSAYVGELRMSLDYN